jgi:hypothetical protein
MAFPGNSLSRHWANSTALERSEETPVLSELSKVTSRPEWFPASKGDMQSLILDRYHYIKNGDGREELYDIESDPWEKRDLAGKELMARRIGAFRNHLQTVVKPNRASQ